METGKKQSNPEIKLYKCFGSPKRAFILGHLFKARKQKEEKVSANIFRNAREMLKRYQVTPASHESVNIALKNQTFQVKTDKKGFFQLDFTPPENETTLSFSVSLERDDTVSQTGTLEIMDAHQVFISDIDDTILVSHSTSLFRKIYTLLSRNFERRKPFEGVQEFYSKLYADNEKQVFFYVSSSEWNLYDFIENFCRHHELPKGIFLLNDIQVGIRQVIKSGGGSHQHKLDKLRRIRDTYERATLTLIGDSGQKDAAIYEEIALEAPDRIKEIFIRDLHKRKRSKMEKVRNRLSKHDIKMHLFN